MSTHGNKLKAIADAIREKDGTTEPIVANDFPARIRAIQTGPTLPDDVRTISLTVSPANGGTVSGGGYASDGMTVTISSEANAADGYLFDGWKEDNAIVTTENTYTFLISVDRSLVAAFSKMQYVVGVNWWICPTQISSPVTDVAYGEGKFIAIRFSTNKIFESNDGKNWVTKSVLPLSASWTAIAYGDGKFVICSRGTGKDAVYSVDGGSTWKKTTLPYNGDFSSIAYGNGRFVAVGSSQNYVIYSTDGATWYPITGLTKVAAIAYGDGTFVIVTWNSTAVYVSNDGLSWASTTLPYGGTFPRIAYGNGRFVVSFGEQKVLYSTNGVDWTASSDENAMDFSDICFGSGKFIATKRLSSNSIYYSEDGESWEEAQMLPVSMAGSKLAYGDGTFVACDGGTNASCYSNSTGP